MGWGYGIFHHALFHLITVGVIARLYAKLNYLSLCGLLAGSMTDPPALAFANELKEGSGAAALSYATVYPLTMFLRDHFTTIVSDSFMGLIPFKLGAVSLPQYLMLITITIIKLFK